MPTFELIHSEPQENKNGNFITAKYDHGKDIITLMIYRRSNFRSCIYKAIARV